MRLFRICIAAIVLVLAPLVLNATGAAAQVRPDPCAPGTSQYPPSACQMRISVTVVTPGATIRVTGGGFRQRTTVTITLTRSNPGGGGGRQGRSLSNALSMAEQPPFGVVTDESGAFDTDVKIPENLTPGRYTLAASGDSGINPDGPPRVLTADFTVVAASANVPAARSQAGGSLARTGFGTLLPVGAGAGLAAAGLGLIFVARRRKAAAA